MLKVFITKNYNAAFCYETCNTKEPEIYITTKGATGDCQQIFGVQDLRELADELDRIADELTASQI